MRVALTGLRFVMQLPLVLAARRSSAWNDIDRDIRRYVQPRLDRPLPSGYTSAELVRAFRHPPFRSVLFARMAQADGVGRAIAFGLRRIYRAQSTLVISCAHIGPGLFIEHGFATIIAAKRLGTDCQIGQQVTIGYADRGGPPELGDRVRITAGAIVIGPVRLGDDSVVGAGAVVVRDVPRGAVVGGVPARVLENAKDRFSALKAKGGDGEPRNESSIVGD